MPLLETLIDVLRSRASLQLELLVMRQQCASLSGRCHGIILAGVRLASMVNCRYLIRDRDSIYGTRFRNRVKSIGIEEVLTAPRSPWQNPYVERIIGSIRRECLNHVIILNERYLRRQLKSYSTYYHEARAHLSLDKQSPVPRSIEPPEQGKVVAIPHVGGLHHEYRRAA